MISIKRILAAVAGFFESATVSYSKISAYDFCPFKYKLLYVNGWKVPPNPFISLGLTVHDALDNYHKRGAETFEELMAVYDELWVNLGFDDPVQALEFHDAGTKMLSDFFEWDAARRRAGIKTVYSEKSFSFFAGRHKVAGIMDRVDRHPDGSYEVIDYKTHRDEWPRERIDGDIQLSLYSLGLKKNFGIKAAKFAFYFLARNDYVVVRRGPSDEKAALAAALRAADAIVRGEFPAETSSCPRCDFRQKCPESSARRVI